jgi:hypothetical protein
MDDAQKRFIALFKGYSKAHGRYDDRKVAAGKPGDKIKGKAVTVIGQPGDKDWEEHFRGTGPGIGMVPLMDDDHCAFGAIDIDDRTIDHLALEKKCERMPVIICRSKSGGAHVYIFFKTPIPATEVRDMLTKWALHLGYGGCEIFPKQTSRANDKDIGNWINLPYYKDQRKALHKGKWLGLKDFVTLAEKRSLSKAPDAAPPKQSSNEPAEVFYEGPPCLISLLRQGGFPEGTRNDGMFSVLIYLRKRWPDDWKARAVEYNERMCDPPLDKGELDTLIGSVARKGYQYRCSQAPIKEHCSRKICLGQRFGVGDSLDGDNSPCITSLTKYEGDPVYWVTEVMGTRFMVTTEELFSPRLFARKCMEKVNRVPAGIANGRWEKHLNEVLAAADIVQVPEDTSVSGQFWTLVQDFLTTRAQARVKEEVMQYKPFREHGRIFFTSQAIATFLESRRFSFDSIHWVWQQLVPKGILSHEWKLAKRKVQVWSIPDLDHEDIGTAPASFASKEPF